MKDTEFVHALRSGKHVFGTMIVSTAPKWPGVVATLGMDFVFIDTEHIALDRSQVSQMCNNYQSLGLPPVVRIPSPDPYVASMMLDGGACGIIASYIETPEQVRQLVGAVKYKPLKGRRLEQLLSGKAAIEQELLSYTRANNDCHALIVNIESVPAMEAFDEILAVEGLDAILIGPHDLSCSLGIPEKYDHPKFLDAVETILGKAVSAKVGAGIHVTYPAGFEREIQWALQGANLIVHSADIIAFQHTMSREIATIREALNNKNFDNSPRNMNI